MNISNGILLSFLAYTAFSTMDLINKFFFAKVEISALNYMLWLNIAIFVAITCLHLLHHRTHALQVLKLKHPKAVLIRAILGTVNGLSSLIAISYLPFHIFYIIIFTQPIVIMLISVLFKLEKPQMIQIFIMLTCFIGIIIALELYHTQMLKINYNIIGIVAGFMISISGALGAIWVKLKLKYHDALTITFYSVVLNIIFAVLLLIGKQEALFTQFTVTTIGLIMLAGFFCALGILLFIKAYQTNTLVQSIALVQYTEIVWGIIFGYFVFATIPSVSSLVGALLVIGANIVNIKYKQ